MEAAFIWVYRIGGGGAVSGEGDLHMGVLGGGGRGQTLRSTPEGR